MNLELQISVQAKYHKEQLLKKAQENESQRANYESKINNLEETIKQLSQVKLEQESEILRLELVARRVKDLEDQLRTAN